MFNNSRTWPGKPTTNGATKRSEVELIQSATEDAAIGNIAFCRPLDGLFDAELAQDAAERLGIGLSGVAEAVAIVREQRQAQSGQA